MRRVLTILSAPQEEALTLEQIKQMVYNEAMDYHTPGTAVGSGGGSKGPL